MWKRPATTRLNPPAEDHHDGRTAVQMMLRVCLLASAGVGRIRAVTDFTKITACTWEHSAKSKCDTDGLALADQDDADDCQTAFLAASSNTYGTTIYFNTNSDACVICDGEDTSGGLTTFTRHNTYQCTVTACESGWAVDSSASTCWEETGAPTPAPTTLAPTPGPSPAPTPRPTVQFASVAFSSERVITTTDVVGCAAGDKAYCAAKPRFPYPATQAELDATLVVATARDSVRVLAGGAAGGAALGFGTAVAPAAAAIEALERALARVDAAAVACVLCVGAIGCVRFPRARSRP